MDLVRLSRSTWGIVAVSCVFEDIEKACVGQIPLGWTLLTDLRQHAPELEEAVALAEEFASMVRNHSP